jgi:nucleolin
MKGKQIEKKTKGVGSKESKRAARKESSSVETVSDTEGSITEESGSASEEEASDSASEGSEEKDGDSGSERDEESIAEETSSGRSSEAEEAGDEEKVQNTIFIKGLSYDLTEHELKEEMEKLGRVIRVGIPMTNEAKRNKGFGYVEFAKAEDAKKALKLNKTMLLGREVQVDMATPRSDKAKYTIYVNNIPYEADKVELRRYFESFGKVVGMSVPYDKENDRYRGFAFVDYANKSDFEAVLRKKLRFEDSDLFQRAANKFGSGDKKDRDGRFKDRSYNGRGPRNDGFKNRKFSDRDEGNRSGGKRSFDDRRAGKKVKFDSESD